MAWIFSRALVAEHMTDRASLLSSRDVVAEYSVQNESAGKPSAPSSGTPTPQAFLLGVKMTARSLLSQYGMTCRPFGAKAGADLLKSFREASLVRTSPLLERALDSMVHDPACGSTWPASLTKWDHSSSSWRTAQRLLEGGWEEFSVTWPRWGIMRNGECWGLTVPGHRTDGNAFGLLPTPGQSGAPNSTPPPANSQQIARLISEMFPTLRGLSPAQDSPESCDPSDPDACEGRKMFPTPGADGFEEEEEWPTPTVHGNHQAPKEGTTRGTGLSTAVKAKTIFPTPVADGDRSTNYAQGGTSLGFAVRNYPGPDDGRMMPTPTASMKTQGDFLQAMFAGDDPNRPSYAEANDPEMWATPTSSRGGNEKGEKTENRGKKLVSQVNDAQRMFPTPRAPSETGGGTGLDGGTNGRKSLSEEEKKELCSAALNPEWVELLMGWPKGWTAQEPLPAGSLARWEAGDVWAKGWEDGTPRIASDVPMRPNRLKGCGNGQVPDCVALVIVTVPEILPRFHG